ncbi:MAG: primosomal protein N' [Rikenellaceae bacterium]
MSQYVDIVLPLALPPFTYSVGDVEGLREGDAVAVEMGQNRDNESNNIYTGIVWRVHNERPNAKVVRSVRKRLYPFALLNARQMKLWNWLAEYYICTLGEIMRVALPSMIKPSGTDSESFAEDEYKPQRELYIKLIGTSKEEATLSEILEKMERKSPRQHSALMQIVEHQRGGETPRRYINTDVVTLTALAKKGIIEFESREIYTQGVEHEEFMLPTLTDHQAEALREIRSHRETKRCTVLHGVTGSGKTEIYLYLIAEAIERGGDALFLLPEIALTSQLLERVEAIFGSRVIVYHSKLSPRKRTENYLRLCGSQHGGNVVVGVRSAIFLPLHNLRLIIVDEEHDPSYKQSDPSPRYNARDCAVMMSSLFDTQTILGSATPSLESWTNSQCGKYGLAMLTHRYGESHPPKIILSDTIRAVKRGERKGHFNTTLLDLINQRINNQEQTILFQNRRGFSPYVECKNCGWTARCPHCNVSMTLHKGSRELVCHYCNYRAESPAECPNCGGDAPAPMGFGTEKIEEQIVELVPNARVVRLDRDTATSQRAVEQIVRSFESGESNILVGTQMISKGFDFSKVTLVGVLNADNLLNSPDFRAEERAFQLLSQVAGRAGRRQQQGEVVVQSSQPQHRLLQFVEHDDFEAMARTLLEERELFRYPPYARLISVTMRHANQNTLNIGANALGARLRAIFGARLQGPTPPPVDRVAREWIVGFMLKIEVGASSAKARKFLTEAIAEWRKEASSHRNINLQCNVDPQ